MDLCVQEIPLKGFNSHFYILSSVYLESLQLKGFNSHFYVLSSIYLESLQSHFYVHLPSSIFNLRSSSCLSLSIYYKANMPIRHYERAQKCRARKKDRLRANTNQCIIFLLNIFHWTGFAVVAVTLSIRVRVGVHLLTFYS